MKLRFTKMSGAGNDFVVIDNRKMLIRKGDELARRVCDRRWGVGADGLLLLEKSKRASYRMMYFNADGSYGGMCGNGGRCIARYAVINRIAPRLHGFEALNHVYEARVGSQIVELSMREPRDLHLGKMIRLKEGEFSFNYVDTGSPHVVIVTTDVRGHKARLDKLDVVDIGRRIRLHPQFSPKGTNVNFIELTRDKSIKIRTYERGVEDETLACGTGSIAAGLVAFRLWNLKPPVKIIPKSGIALTVDFVFIGGRFRGVKLIGPAVVVFDGVMRI